MEKKILDSSLTYYDLNKQLMKNERSLDPIELNIEVSLIRKSLAKNNIPKYLMLLCNDRKDYTVFNFIHKDEESLNNFEKDLKECLINRGNILTIEEKKDSSQQSWEIWIRDIETKENFCYYLFDYSNAVIEC